MEREPTNALCNKYKCMCYSFSALTLLTGHHQQGLSTAQFKQYNTPTRGMKKPARMSTDIKAEDSPRSPQSS